MPFEQETPNLDNAENMEDVVNSNVKLPKSRRFDTRSGCFGKLTQNACLETKICSGRLRTQTCFNYIFSKNTF
jgi:hypothetical protein